jgi:hypothetical protein
MQCLLSHMLTVYALLALLLCIVHIMQIEAAHVAIASAVAAAAAHSGSTTEGALPATVNVLRTLRDKVRTHAA